MIDLYTCTPCLFLYLRAFIPHKSLADLVLGM